MYLNSIFSTHLYKQVKKQSNDCEWPSRFVV